MSEQEQEPLTIQPAQAALLTPYLPPPPPASSPPSHSTNPKKIHVTLTYAQSLDSSLALAPGLRTVLSGAQSKAMTHFLRSRHAAILVGAGTAVADDPGLNSRLSSGSGAGSQPRPVVLDPRARWAVHEGSKVIRHARDGKGLAPFVLVDQDRFGMELGDASGVDEGRRRVLESVGGRYIPLKARGPNGRFEWVDVLAVLEREGLGSVMIEGGGEVINSLLAPPGNGLVDSVIVTIAPTWLGRGGVVVSPPRMRGEEGAHATPVRLTDVSCCPFGEDVVLCGRILR